MDANDAMSEAPSDSFETGTMVAHRYRVRSYLGDRGFGQVYEAQDSAMVQRVALMRLNREFSRPKARESFFDTRSTATVDDPRIVDLCDYGEDVDGRLFLVMPWVEGAEALDELLAREGVLAWPRAKAIVKQTARALEAAHKKGVLHGALEPSRVFIDKRGGVHIVDFGLAPALAPPGLVPPKQAGSVGPRVTFSGPLPGKIEYLSPEQIRGEAVDARSDIYALGVMLWELVSGAPPFVGDPVTVAEAHLDAALPEFPRGAEFPRGVAGGSPNRAPTELEPLLHLALTKASDDRIASAGEFLTLLEAMPGAREQRPGVTRAATPRLPDGPPRPPRRSAPTGPPGSGPPASGPPANGPPGPGKTVLVNGLPNVSPAGSGMGSAMGSAIGSPSGPAMAPPPADALAGVPRAIDPDPDPSPSAPPLSHSPTPPPPKRRLGKLELAIVVFLALDLLLFGAWKLFTSADPAEPTVAAEQLEQAQPNDERPEPTLEPEPPPKPVAVANPAPKPPLTVEQAIASEFPPEPDNPGPVRPMADSLSDKALRETLVSARAQMLAECLDTRMRRTLKISLKVAPDGSVAYARVRGSLAKTSLGECVIKEVYKVEFPPTYEGGSHTYTLRLR